MIVIHLFYFASRVALIGTPDSHVTATLFSGDAGINIVNKGKREGWRKVREGKKVRETRSERAGWRERAERSMRSLDQSRDRIDEMSQFDWCA